MDTKKKILVIEDEGMLLEALKKKFEEEGFDVITAQDGVTGLQTALSQQPDLILLDLVLPMMDGMSLLGSLRKNDWGSTVPVIVLSNLNRMATQEKVKDEDISEYLVKTDWKIGEVVDKVKSTLGMTA